VTYTFYKNKYLKKVNNCFETTVDSLKGKLAKNPENINASFSNLIEERSLKTLFMRN
jgi:hypothetical protein